MTTPDTSEVQQTVNGQTVSGHLTTNGGFISDDGTVYVDPSGAVQHGISAPDGTFIQGGSTHVLPDGTTLYGTAEGSSFSSYDGSTVVLDDGTVLHGHIDPSTGIFTADGGGTYAVTNTGIYAGTTQGDGSLQLSNGQTVMTPGAWAVDLQALSDAATQVQTKADSISDHIDDIVAQFTTVPDVWSSPAGETFSDAATKASAAMNTLKDLLSSMVSRMRTTHDNYAQAEQTNIANNSNYS